MSVAYAPPPAPVSLSLYLGGQRPWHDLYGTLVRAPLPAAADVDAAAAAEAGTPWLMRLPDCLAFEVRAAGLRDLVGSVSMRCAYSREDHAHSVTAFEVHACVVGGGGTNACSPKSRVYL